MARQIDADKYHDTARSLLSAANGDEELTMLVDEQLKDMLETGYFDLEGEKLDKRRKST